MRLTHSHAFTLVELLVTLAIIGLLISILLPALSRARDMCRQVRSASNARQLMTGYTLYTQDYDGHLMFGYPADVVNGRPTTAQTPNGPVPSLIAKRYPWRLIGYVTDVWDLVYDHTATPERSDSYGLSISPTYGLNSFYVGGDDTALGFVGTGSKSPNYGSHAVYRDHAVRKPDQLLVFGDADNSTTVESDGFYRLTPPKAGIDWLVLTDGRFRAATGTATGVPRARYGMGIVSAFYDTHVKSLTPTQLNDMRLWANDARTPDYNF